MVATESLLQCSVALLQAVAAFVFRTGIRVQSRGAGAPVSIHAVLPPNWGESVVLIALDLSTLSRTPRTRDRYRSLCQQLAGHCTHTTAT